MRKFKSLTLIALSVLVIASCSSSEKPVEQASEQELFSTGANYLQEGNYTQATRYLEAVDSRFPGSSYSEQAELNLIFSTYKSQDYTKTLTTADRFLQQFPQSQHLDYVLYMAALTNSALGDNLFQDFFGVDRSTRETTSMKTAFSNFQTLVQNFPNSPYTPDALARMAYIKDRLARHELEIAKFYAKRSAWVATSNRITGMLRSYPDTQATLEALPLLQESYEKMGLTQLASQAATLVKANEGRVIKEAEKPKEPFLSLPSWLSFGSSDSSDKEKVATKSDDSFFSWPSWLSFGSKD
ncbi:outer membrane protein assembly factor BamD [Basfia succiniciproducens]|uniref:Outer membrane protein assembly factor BamD n=1 Tax=Basfia succiniciproducens TaxID=653940 RepID=A0A1G5DZ96_9PAST|nr:outer membrane protein assembly factor BamD [Basfia succiniciproducens]QIM69060.1 outer membrane assembly protein BamD [Basfia succiniciproducens]SCY19947.1 Beta-barrel assembly machine subunit BamD [Basfia succiniciproducens]SEQ44925.1 Beta-barrel assembly machine subunit BamD [Basfia succiniciproducens]